MSFTRRKGLEWDSNGYIKLLRYINMHSIVINESSYREISDDELKNLSKTVFPLHGHRKSYQEQVRFFLQCYHFAISEDLVNIKSNNNVVYAPKLKHWFAYKEKLCSAMCMEIAREHTLNYLKDPNYKIPLHIKKEILKEMFGCEKTDLGGDLMKELNNHLCLNFAELCYDIKMLIEKSQCSKNDKDKDKHFKGFDEKEINVSVMIHDKLNDNMNIVNNRAKSEINVGNRILRIQKIKKKSIGTRKRSVLHVYEKVSEPVINFFTKKDTDEQVNLLKKLIILSVLSRKNEALQYYMNGTGRINKANKKILLESIYDVENIKNSHYTLLDLLIAKRYLMKKKVEEVTNLLKSHKINFHKKCEGMSFFCDAELKFYEVLKEIKNSTDFAMKS